MADRDEFEFETPEAMMRRLRLGREEHCQRLLTSLLLHGPYPRWNSRSRLSPEGTTFLRRLHERCFDGGWPSSEPWFVDEYELVRRVDLEKGAAPDYALLWDERVWLIELKTEKASHRAAQVPYYFELARHHHPEVPIDLTYLTGPMDAPYEPVDAKARYAHVVWGDLVPLIRETWPEPVAPGQRAVVDGLVEAIESLGLAASEWRRRFEAPPPPPAVAIPGTTDALDHAMDLAELTAADHQQRGIEVAAETLEDLLDERLVIREEIAAAPYGSPIRHVRPWIWRPESTGAPLTALGAERGLEIRLSWYEKPI